MWKASEPRTVIVSAAAVPRSFVLNAGRVENSVRCGLPVHMAYLLPEKGFAQNKRSVSAVLHAR